METTINESLMPSQREANLQRLLRQDREAVKPHPPHQVYEWVDALPTGAKGWIVIDRADINGVAGGGIYMHSKATCDETADIARNMSRKFTVNPRCADLDPGVRAADWWRQGGPVL
jgi:hypothetical protein